MKNKFIISYEVVGGGGSQEIELEIPEDAYNIKITPVVRNTGEIYILRKTNITIDGGAGGFTTIKSK